MTRIRETKGELFNNVLESYRALYPDPIELFPSLRSEMMDYIRFKTNFYQSAMVQATALL